MLNSILIAWLKLTEVYLFLFDRFSKPASTSTPSQSAIESRNLEFRSTLSYILLSPRIEEVWKTRFNETFIHVTFPLTHLSM